MLTITNGRETLQVTKGAYAALYKHQGYIVVNRGRKRNFSPNYEGESNSPQAKMVPNGEESSNETIPTGSSSINPSLEDPGEYNTEEEEDEEETPLSEIPLTDMTKSQLMEYADQLGIEYTGEETKKQLRTLIRAVL